MVSRVYLLSTRNTRQSDKHVIGHRRPVADGIGACTEAHNKYGQFCAVKRYFAGVKIVFLMFPCEISDLYQLSVQREHC
jgi:hypothetical protein